MRIAFKTRASARALTPCACAPARRPRTDASRLRPRAPALCRRDSGTLCAVLCGAMRCYAVVLCGAMRCYAVVLCDAMRRCYAMLCGGAVRIALKTSLSRAERHRSAPYKLASNQTRDADSGDEMTMQWKQG